MRPLLRLLALALIPLLPSCNGGGAVGFGSPVAALPTSHPAPASSPVHIIEFPSTDTFLGGLTIGADDNLYATTKLGIDIFNPNSEEISRQSDTGIRPQTWPVVHSLVATGAISNSANSTVTALGSQSGSVTSSIADGTMMQTPALVQYSILTKQFQITYGKPGDVFEDLTEAPDASLWVAANTPTSKGLIGYAFSNRSGCAIPRLQGAAGNVTVGPDGFIWVTSDPDLNPNTQSQVVRIDPSTGLITNTYTLGHGSVIGGITAGPDGALWFTDAGLNEIGRLTTHGDVSYFAVPHPNSGLLAITTGCDNASLWFTEKTGNRIGRISLQGAVTEFPVPTPDAGLGEIVGCVNGSLFFTETHAIGEIIVRH